MQSVKVSTEIDNGLSVIKVEAEVSFDLVDASFDHAFGTEKRIEIDTDKPHVEILDMVKVSAFGSADYNPPIIELKLIHKKLIERAMAKLNL